MSVNKLKYILRIVDSYWILLHFIHFSIRQALNFNGNKDRSILETNESSWLLVFWKYWSEEQFPVIVWRNKTSFILK